MLRFTALDIGGNHTEVTLADIKNEGGCSVGCARADHGTRPAKRFESIVAGTRFAAHRDRLAASELEDAAQPAGGSLLDDIGHGSPDSPSDLRRNDLLARVGRALHDGFIGRSRGKMNSG